MALQAPVGRLTLSFSSFLKKIRNKYKIDSISRLYEFFGGRENINMGQRNLAMLESGELKPTVGFLASVSRKLDPQDYREAILAFFEANLDADLDKNLLSYLKNNLSPSHKAPNQKLTKEHEQIELSDQQLTYLSENYEGLFLFNKVAVLSSVPLTKDINMEIADDLVRLKLIDITGKELVCTSTRYRLPSFPNSSPRKVRLASKVILNHISAYLSEDGSNQQQLLYTFQQLSETQILYVYSELQRLKSLIFEMSQSTTLEKKYPFIFVSFARKILEKELK